MKGDCGIKKEHCRTDRKPCNRKGTLEYKRNPGIRRDQNTGINCGYSHLK